LVRVKGAVSFDKGKFADGGGLWLVKLDRASGKWIPRVTIHGKRREIGLGTFPSVSLAEARRSAEEARAVVRARLDPIKERQRVRREAMRNMHVLRDIALDAFEAERHRPQSAPSG